MKFLLLLALGLTATLANESRLLKEYHEGYTQFTANVFKELLKTNPGNFLVCPMSVDIILALVNDGAEGQTAHEFSAGLHLPESKDKIRRIFTKLAPYLQGDEDYTLTSANKIYLKHGFEIKDQFKSTAVDVFHADIQNIDFSQKDAAATEMNKWVEEQTHDKIKDLIKPADLSPGTQAVLINAMYFHGKWKSEFKKDVTRTAPFYLNSEDHVETEMMHQVHQFLYHESSELNAKFLQMPYKGDEVTMTIVLPNDKDGLSALEENIAEALVEPRYYKQKVHVLVPKFKIETSIEFLPILQALGINDAFTNEADFSGISKDKIKVSKVIQKALIEVEEEGTTAAAATAVFTGLTHSLVSQPLKYFVADHPFIYYLKSSAGILFIGHYTQA